MENVVMIWLLVTTGVAFAALMDGQKHPYNTARRFMWLGALMVIVFGFVFGYVAPAQAETRDVCSQQLITDIDRHGNVHHSFKRVCSEIVITDGGVNVGGDGLNVFGSKYNRSGERRPICKSTEFWVKPNGMLTCDAIEAWALR